MRADLVQVAPPETGTAQPNRDPLAELDVHAVATVGPADADDVAPGVTPWHGGTGLGGEADGLEQADAAQKDGDEDA